MRVEVLDFRLDSVEGTGSGNARDDKLVPDFILPMAGCCRYGGSDACLNARAVGFEHRDGGGVVFSDKLDVVVCGELYGGNKRFLNCRVDGIANGEVVGVVWECCAISLNDNDTVPFGYIRRGCLLAWWRGSAGGGRAAGALAALWAHLRVGSGAIGLDGRVVVVAPAGCWLCCCCSWAVWVVT